MKKGRKGSKKASSKLGGAQRCLGTMSLSRKGGKKSSY